MESLCQFLLRTPPQPLPATDEVASFWAQRLAYPLSFPTPVERAAAMGFLADRLGYAFAAGYQEALTQLLADTALKVSPQEPLALCATELGGAHPRAIATRLTAVDDAEQVFVLDGEKAFVTLGDQAHRLLIIASRGADEAGRNRLAAVCIPADRAGVTLAAGPQTSFVPEIPHASLRLQQVAVGRQEHLPGDGYERYLKPFRTVEDVHVHAALLGHLLQLGRRFGWPEIQQSETLALLVALLPIAAAPPLSPATHIALAGVIEATARLVERSEPLWARVDAEIAQRWRRDRRLLSVAGSARTQRTASAWRTVEAS